MSDLQCPARFLLARHGQAEYESELLMDHGGTLTKRGRDQARALGRQLHGENVAHVYASTLSRAVQTAELAAGVLGVDVTVREGLVEVGVGELIGQPGGSGVFLPVLDQWVAGAVDARFPGGASGAEVAERVGAVLDDLADLHRGETVLVVTHAGAILATLAVLAGRRGSSRIENCSYAAVERDADGWRLAADLTSTASAVDA